MSSLTSCFHCYHRVQEHQFCYELNHFFALCSFVLISIISLSLFISLPVVSVSDSTTVSTTTESEDSEPDFQIIRRSVPIPQPDNETFTNFFQSSSTAVLTEGGQLSAISEQKQDTTFELSVSDFDALTEEASQR